MTTKPDKNENIFDLSKLAQVELHHEVEQESKKINVDDQVKLLADYDEIKSDKWDTLVPGDHIRYLRLDGNFRRGGFFKNAWVSDHGPNSGKKCIQLASSIYNNNYGGNYKPNTWIICHRDIDKIWKKKSNVNLTSNENSNENQKKINENKEEISYLKKNIEQLKIDTLKINNEQKRIINLIKKLHGVRSSTTTVHN
jgi:hypothetical protein